MAFPVQIGRTDRPDREANRRWAIVGREDQWARLRDQADPGRGSPSGDLLRGPIRLEEQEDPHRQASVKEAPRE